MQAMCAEFSGHPPLGRVTGDAADPAERPDVPWCGRRPAGRRANRHVRRAWPHSRPSIDRAWPPGRVMNQTKRSHRTQLKKQVGRGDN
jgi:hypothetical protein